ncbi:acetate/propionate family kinase [Methylorubrum sp. B1-46]|uniref:acetate/propionate family kinase n=1 Tax=Methylorubrum sp. B1-46 TaxID=2897334 RepID=UPI001E38135F|nr:acetate/propionate family kinase [Methylorubrum sp. B1-46]UGB26146.1 acetate/propionate family kinase [Methylorubrum sp. B1-46]
MSRSIALTLNAGSSSLKFAVYDIARGEPEEIAIGLIERIGDRPRIKMKAGGELFESRDLGARETDTPASTLDIVLTFLQEHLGELNVTAVGHRVVHGGPHYAVPVLVTSAMLDELRALSSFAPLHQPHNIAGIEAALTAFPEAIQVACFDTAFHRHQPKVNDVFALPREYYDKGVRRYGFHGLSYEYIAGELKRIAPLLYDGRVVVAHLGNGASMCAMLGGRSIASTMGFTALDGLPMGTRCGQIDPGVVFYLVQQEGKTIDEVRELFYSKSGLLGLSGLSNDMCTLEAAATPEAMEAIDYFVFRIRRELGGLAAALGGIDALVFCGGIGENSRYIRERVCEGLDWIGIELDRERNKASERRINGSFSRTHVLVIPTNEEIVIARAVKNLMRSPYC